MVRLSFSSRPRARRIESDFSFRGGETLLARFRALDEDGGNRFIFSDACTEVTACPNAVALRGKTKTAEKTALHVALRKESMGNGCAVGGRGRRSRPRLTLRLRRSGRRDPRSGVSGTRAARFEVAAA